MTAELLVRIGAFGAYIRSFVVTRYERVVQFLALPGPESLLREKERARNQKGFTLIELMTTLAIVGVLSTMMAPSVAGMMETERVKSVTYDLFIAVAHARAEAVMRGVPATLSPHDGSFSKGYDLQAKNDLILSNPLASAGVAIKTPTNEAIGYDQYGRPTMAVPYQFEISSMRDKTVPKRCVTVGLGGRVSLEVDKNLDGDCNNG